MADFNQALEWLKEGKKVRPKNWREECFIYYDKCFKGCYDEVGRIINLKALSGEKDWEIYEEGYYRCKNCSGVLEEKDMGHKCKYCKEWTYRHECFRKGEKPEKETLSDKRKCAADNDEIYNYYKSDDLKETIDNVKEDILEYANDELGDEIINIKELQKVIDILDNRFGENFK